MSERLRDALERDRKELEADLDGTIEDDIRRAIVPNSVAWFGVVIGAFVINLLLLVVITGG